MIASWVNQDRTSRCKIRIDRDAAWSGLDAAPHLCKFLRKNLHSIRFFHFQRLKSANTRSTLRKSADCCDTKSAIRPTRGIDIDPVKCCSSLDSHSVWSRPFMCAHRYKCRQTRCVRLARKTRQSLNCHACIANNRRRTQEINSTACIRLNCNSA